ncbi:siphovirus Gp157 family protein [Neisseria gonorrhoeae]|uniref:siphovirus Gp157 family protein n=1 Tax=Neisseria gonorrhoeae TaxID=485 RepID=UPI0021E3AC1A|nr:siphovirus Gp157 family protein [Neisseria gonorrhoeae]
MARRQSRTGLHQHHHRQRRPIHQHRTGIAIHAALGEAVAEYEGGHDDRPRTLPVRGRRTGGDFATFDSETEREDTLEAVIGQFEVKAQSVIAYIKNQEITEKMLEGHIRQMTGKLKAAKARNQSLKDYLARNMQAAGITEIKADDGTFKASFRKSEAVVILDEAQIPAEFAREAVKTEPDKTAIKKAIESGRQVAGAKIEGRKNLQIR